MADRAATIALGAISARTGEIVSRRGWAIGLVAAIAAGIVFRLLWLHDVEYKLDEAWVFDQVRAFWQSHTLLPVGISSSEGLPHPGLNLWVFLFISAFLPTVGPLELTRAVQVVNVLAIGLLALFAQRGVERPEREAWLWAVALVAVNPLAVLYSRKLWAQDLLPLFTLAMLVGWWHRHRRWGALLWGLAGALLGQVHLSGFLFAAAFFALTLWFDRRAVRWPAWFGGSLLGLIPLLPWLVAARSLTAAAGSSFQFNNPVIPFGDWINFSLGLDLYKTLGADFVGFIAFPTIGPHATYLAAALLASVVLIGVVLMARLVHALRLDRRRTATFLFGAGSSTGLALSAAFFGYCSLLAVMSHTVYLHYFIVCFPLPALWLARIAQAGAGDDAVQRSVARRLLAVLVAAQAGVTLMLLSYIHQAQIIHGDYGTVFGAQVQ
jgi:hypothetical protein